MANDLAGGVGAASQGLGLGERLALAGAAGVVALWLVFDLILQDYFVGHLPLLLSALVLLAAFRVQNAAPILSYDTAVLVCAISLGLLGVISLVEDVRYNIFDPGGLRVVGAILFWIASLVAGAGAVSLLQRRG